MSIVRKDAQREHRTGWAPGPRVRPLTDRYRISPPGSLTGSLSEVFTVGRVGAPVVGVTLDQDDMGPYVTAAVVDAVVRCGGEAWLIAPGQQLASEDLDRLDAVVVTGGAFDIHPRHYGQAVAARLDRVDEDRTSTELSLCAAAVARGLPLLGLCGGMQALVVALGGTLIQHLATGAEHEQPTDPAEAWHPVRLAAPLAAWWGASEVRVNSTHHQAADRLAGGLEAVGWSPDGVVEAAWLPSHPFALGVQWHPERLGDDVPFARLLDATAPARAPERAPAPAPSRP